MKIDRKKAYLFELILILILLICAFFFLHKIKFILTGITLVSAIGLSLLLKKKPNTFSNKDKVFKVMIAFAIVYVALFYCLGIYTGFYRNMLVLNVQNFFAYIVNTTIVIVSTEIIREKLLTIKTKSNRFLVNILTIIIEVLLYGYIYQTRKLDNFLLVTGFITFSAISSNMMYTYICEKFGSKPVIAYRLILGLYQFILPIVPDVYVYFRSFIKMIFPYVNLHEIKPIKTVITRHDATSEITLRLTVMLVSSSLSIL